MSILAVVAIRVGPMQRWDGFHRMFKTADALELQKGRLGLRPCRALVVLLAVCGTAVCMFQWAIAGTFQDDYESPETSWQIAEGDAAYALTLHERTTTVFRTGEWSETLQFQFGHGTQLFLKQAVEPALLVDELTPRLWVRATRAGPQLYCRIVLPRTINPDTGEPLAAIVAGDSYQNPGQWQQLSITDLPMLLKRQAWKLRHEYPDHVDTHEAYIDQILLNAYTGVGELSIWMDGLRLDGFVPRRATDPSVRPAGYTQEPLGPAESPLLDAHHEVRASGSMLLVDRKPYFARIIEYRGEAPSFLSGLGFNAVWFAKPPTVRQLREVTAAGLYVVCPPPVGAPGNSAAASPRDLALAALPEYANVLAWNLGRHDQPADFEAFKTKAQQVRQADAPRPRPLTAQIHTDLAAASRYVDILTLRGHSLGSTTPLADHGAWLESQATIAQPGLPLWANVPTQWPEDLVRQLSGWMGSPSDTSFSYEAMRLAALGAVSHGARGLVFQSSTPLDNPDVFTQARARSLEMINQELLLLAPWAAAGELAITVKTGSPQVTAAVLNTDRARLALPVWADTTSHGVVGQASASGLTLKVPGVPESHSAYEVTPVALRSLGPQRISQGTMVTLDEFDTAGMVLFTQDPNAYVLLTRRIDQNRARAAALMREQLAWRLSIVDRVFQAIAPQVRPIRAADEWLATSRSLLGQADFALNSRDFDGAYHAASRGLRLARQFQQAYWDPLQSVVGAPGLSPFGNVWDTLPEHARLMRDTRRARFGPNRIPGGRFESLQETLAAGWQRIEQPQSAWKTNVDVAGPHAHSGRQSLAISVEPADPLTAPPFVESAPVWVESPPVAVLPGERFRIRVWVQVNSPITRGVDGLVISDSLGGRSLARRIQQTSGWEEVIFFRAAADSSPLVIRFAMTGTGQALIDDVSVEPWDESIPAGPNPFGPPGPADPVNRFGPPEMLGTSGPKPPLRVGQRDR